MKAEIEINGTGTAGRIMLDGHDVAAGVRGFVLRSEVGRMTELELDVAVVDDSQFGGEVRVVIPDSTREALVALGWTPPAAE